MRIGLNGGGHQHALDDVLDAARRAQAGGFSSFWLSQITGPDALTALTVVGREVPDLELGTSIVPLYGRHPFVLAQQALTVQAACGGRLTLGIGPSHQLVVEGVLGESYAKPFTRTAEFLRALSAYVAGEGAAVEGETLTARGQLGIDAPAPPIFVAALGPKMLDLAGREAHGTALWMVGPKTIGAHIAPRIREAAEAAGRPAPRILAGATVCVTDDPAGARARAAEQLAIYGQLPAYKRMMDQEGVDGPGDLLIAGSKEEVVDQIAAYAEAGATDLRAGPLAGDPDEMAATFEVLSELARAAR